MTINLKPYPEYKESGVPWLGKVPGHWENRKFRSILFPIAERNRPEWPLLSVVREKGVIVRNIKDDSENHNAIPDDLINYKVVHAGQFAMNKMKAWQGSFGISKYDGIVSPAYFVFNLEKVEPSFFHIAARSKAYVPFFTAASDGVRVGQWDLSLTRMKEIPFFIPSIQEQTQIARFLDYKSSQISRFIRAKKRMIELLKEQKQAIINDAVTGKIDVRTGKPYPKYKDSGVEWLGKVPEEWEVLKLGYLFHEVDLRSEAGEEEHLSMSQKHGGLVRSTNIGEKRLLSESYAGGKICLKGNIVLNRLKAHLGVFAVAPSTGVISPDYTVLRQIGNNIPEFYEYLLRSTIIRPELRKKCKGIVEGFWRLYTDDLYSIKVPFPPQEEQLEVLQGIQQSMATIDLLISRAEREISLLQEYRTRLIADVVTGKIDVRGMDVPEDQEKAPVEEIESEGEYNQDEAEVTDLESVE